MLEVGCHGCVSRTGVGWHGCVPASGGCGVDNALASGERFAPPNPVGTAGKFTPLGILALTALSASAPRFAQPLEFHTPAGRCLFVLPGGHGRGRFSRFDTRFRGPPVAKLKTKKGDAVVKTNRRDSDRRGNDRRKQEVPVAAEQRTLERRVKVNRRRQIDPTTCERDYTPDEVEFMNAMNDYKRTSGRMFPTCSEILEVIATLGYAKQPSSALPASSSDAGE